MKAHVYQGPNQRSWDSVPDPTIQQPSDIVVEVATATICGSDLHILKGDVPETRPGTVQAHDVFADSAKTDALNVVLTGNTAMDEQRDEAAAAASGLPPRHLHRV